MAAKQLQFDEAARHALLRGVEKLARAVKATLGPSAIVTLEKAVTILEHRADGRRGECCVDGTVFKVTQPDIGRFIQRHSESSRRKDLYQ